VGSSALDRGIQANGERPAVFEKGKLMKKLFALAIVFAGLAIAQPSTSTLTVTATYVTSPAINLILPVRTVKVEINDTASDVAAFFVALVYDNQVGATAILTQSILASPGKSGGAEGSTNFGVPSNALNVRVVAQGMSFSGVPTVVAATLSEP
jgi:hypothetical protein